MNKKIISFILFAVLVMPSLVGCRKSPDRREEETPPLPIPAVTADVSDYVYMWHPDGVRGNNSEMRILSSEYSLTVDSENGRISGIKNGQISFDNGFADMDSIVQTMTLTVGNENYTAKKAVRLCDIDDAKEQSELYSRVIESGRYVQRMDVLWIEFDGTQDYHARLEISARRGYFTVSYEIWAQKLTRNAYLMFKMSLPSGYTGTVGGDGKSVSMRRSDGMGYAFSTLDEGGGVYAEGSSVVVYLGGKRLSANTFSGMSFTVYPLSDANDNPVSDADYASRAEITARQLAPKDKIHKVTFDASEGQFNIDLNGGVGLIASSDSSEIHNRLERITLTLKNNTDKKINIPLQFEKDSHSATPDFPVFGLAPMLRDAVSGEPLGIPVQISKSWNYRSSNQSRFDYAPSVSPLRTFENVWYHGYAEVELGPNETKEIEYTCAFTKWGGVNPISHSQLCITGWGGNQLWEETSLVPWTETMCYDPDQALASCFVGDVRSIYNSATNAGGAEFLVYYNGDGERVYNHNVIARYNSQGPNLTDCEYTGVTQDGNIAVSYRVNMGRTDDIGRAYYTIKYTFLKDTSFNRLAFFQMHADRYGDNDFQRNAYGNLQGVVSDKTYVPSVDIYEGGEPQRNTTEGTDQWFFLYSNGGTWNESGNVYAVVREYNASLNGTTYTTPNFNERHTSHGKNQLSFELTVPKGIDTIKAGSTVEMVLEYGTMADKAADYFGTVDYILAENNFGTAAQAYTQVKSGKISVNASVGTVRSTYPVEIETDGESGVVAEFKLTGGLGYVSVRFTGLPAFGGWRLQKKVGDEWQTVDQSTFGNDYWQCDYNAVNKKYSLVFNVKNTEGTATTENSYRLIKI